MGILKNVNRLWSVGRDRVVVSGSFRPNGTSAVAAANNRGTGWSVARTSEGLFTITFDKVGHQLDSVVASARDVSGSSVIAVPGVWDKANKTLQIYTKSVGSGYIPLDITALREIASNDIQNLAAHGGLLATDSVPDLYRVNGATDKALKVEWKVTEVDEVAFPPVALPPDFGGACTVHCLWSKDANTDTAMVVDVQAFSGLGGTEMGGNTAAINVAADTLFETQVALTATNVGDHPGMLNLALVPGAHANDVLRLHAAWIEYDQLKDMASDSNNFVNFVATFKNTRIKNEK